MIDDIDVAAGGDNVAKLSDRTGACGDEVGGGVIIVLIFAEVEDDDMRFLLNELANEMVAEKAGPSGYQTAHDL